MENKPNNSKEDEFILYQEGGESNENPSNSNKGEESESSKEEYITNEEFLLECARFDELDELKKAMKDMKDLNVNYKDFRGNTALHMASANGHSEMVLYLLKELKCNINETNNSNSTALSWAALNGQKDVVNILLNNGADTTIKNKSGKTASEEAYNSGYYEISESIITVELKQNKEKHEGIIEEDGEDEK
ncbi:MAG: ankyrin repeat domain-containing protein [archaeon]|nr:ankyrin repeat domain-containing protein [archaeon]